MRQFLKNISLFALAILFLAPMSYTFICYQFQLKSIKKEVKSKLIKNTPQKDLVYLEFDLESAKFSNLEWKHNQEFAFENKMFDIVEADTIGQTVQYLCFPDKQETALNAKFKYQLYDRYAKDKPLNKEKNRVSIFLLSLYFHSEDMEQEVTFNPSLIKYGFLQEDYQSILLYKKSPPPQIFS